MAPGAKDGFRRDRRPRPRRDAVAVERGRHWRMLLATCWYGLLGLMLLSTIVTLMLGLTGQIPTRPTSDALRLGGLGLVGFGVSGQVLLDYFLGPPDGGDFIRFTRTGWRLGAPVWAVGLAAFAAGSLLTQA